MSVGETATVVHANRVLTASHDRIARCVSLAKHESREKADRNVNRVQIAKLVSQGKAAREGPSVSHV